jgi:ribosomal protein S18 acetylase RimI-like enzyme
METISPTIVKNIRNICEMEALIITESTLDDVPEIRDLFAAAIEYQKTKSGNPWRGLNEPGLINEISNRLHWKILEGNRIAAFFSIAFTDRLIWDERDADPAIYLHRIVTNPAFRGRGYVNAITDWAEAYGREAGKLFIRLDTDRDNARLNAYYQQCGYTNCGIKTFHDTNNPLIPKHYFGSGLSLYEKPIRVES